MKQVTDEPFETFCIGFEGEGMAGEGFSSDKDYAIQVASANKVSLNHVTAKEDFVKDLGEMVYYLDEPQADPAPLYVKTICEKAKSHGIKVMLSGTGGDDVFSGYRRHQVTAMLDKYGYIPAWLQSMALGTVSSVLPNGALKRRLQKLKGIVSAPDNKRLLHAFYYTQPSLLVNLLNGDLKQAYEKQTADYLEKVLASTTCANNLDKQLNLEMHGFLPDHNLNYTDKMSMAAGVEVRTPFTSKKMIEFGFSLLEEQKVHNGEAKFLLKTALEDRLDEDVLYRDKAGFGAPVRTWLLKEEAFVREILLSKKAMGRNLFNAASVNNLIENTKSGKVDGAYTILSLLVIELWLLQFYDLKQAKQIDFK